MAARVLDLSALTVHEIELTYEGWSWPTTAEQVAAAVLETNEQTDGLARFRLQDVSGCVTAIPVERRGAGVSWEPVVPVLDRHVLVDEATTVHEVLVELAAGLRATGVPFTIDFLRIGPAFGNDVFCAVPGGTRVARDILVQALGCLPDDPTYSFNTTGDGRLWWLAIHGYTARKKVGG